jgi:hypothetical protein
MSEEVKNIEELFRGKFENLEADGTDSWDQILKATNRKLFFRFIPQRFNIYYLSLVMATTGGIAYFALSNNSKGVSTSPTIESVSPANTEVTKTPENNKTVVADTVAVQGFKKVDIKKATLNTNEEKTSSTANTKAVDLKKIDNHIQSVMNDSLFKTKEPDLAVKIESHVETIGQASADSTSSIKKDTVVIETKELKVIEKTVKRKR